MRHKKEDREVEEGGFGGKVGSGRGAKVTGGGGGAGGDVIEKERCTGSSRRRRRGRRSWGQRAKC